MYADRMSALTSAIEECRDAETEAMLWSFEVTHATLTLRMTPPSGREPVIFTLKECRRIECNVRWRGVFLEFRQLTAEPPRYELRDSRAGFRVECGLILIGDPGDPRLQEVGR